MDWKRMHVKFARDMEDTDKKTHRVGWEKVIWHDALRLWYVVPRTSLYELTISSAILTKLASHPVVGCVVQEMRLYLI